MARIFDIWAYLRTVFILKSLAAEGLISFVTECLSSTHLQYGTCVCACVCVWVSNCVFLHMLVSMSVCMCLYVCMCVSVCVCEWVCVYVSECLYVCVWMSASVLLCTAVWSSVVLFYLLREINWRSSCSICRDEKIQRGCKKEIGEGMAGDGTEGGGRGDVGMIMMMMMMMMIWWEGEDCNFGFLRYSAVLYFTTI
jgi:hypothetical protein